MMKLARFLKYISFKNSCFSRNNSTSDLPQYQLIRKKIDFFIKSLEECDIDYVEISLSGNAGIFDPKREIDTMELKKSMQTYNVQYYLPHSKKIDATVFLRSKKDE